MLILGFGDGSASTAELSRQELGDVRDQVRQRKLGSPDLEWNINR
jgi:hypothetical protein